jgi:chalcone isomerase-like protein
MRMNASEAMLTKVLLVATLAIASNAAALDVEGVKLADRTTVGGRELVLNGAGVRKRAIFKVYVGSLYVPAKATSLEQVLAGQPRRIQLNLLRDLSADQLVGALMDGLKQNLAPAELAAISTQTGELAAIMKSFGEAKEGSVVTLDFVDDATKIGLDGTARGSIDGAAFNDALTRIWIGEHPAQADLKKAMLGGA